MQGNDLASYAPRVQATMFEGVLASEPTGKLEKIKASYLLKSEKWDAYLKMWQTNTLPVKHLSDSIHRLGVGTEVYTLLPPGFAEAVDRWLLKKGISTNVVSFDNINDLAFELQFNRGITKIYTADQEQAKVIGMRATVVSTNTAWSL
jgi:hypothetical protein